MINPCPGCDDPYLAAAIVCYLSFFLSGCSFFLYWYWLANYRDEQDPLECRYPDPDSEDCETLEPEPIDVNVPDDENEIVEGEIHSLDINIDINVDVINTQGSEELCPHSPHEAVVISSVAREGGEGDEELATLTTTSTTTNSSPSRNQNQNHHQSHQNLPSDNLDNIINSINDNDNDNIGIEHNDEDTEDNQQGKSALSDNPYLNGNTYSHNVLWGLHGIFTNLIESILALIFYSGLFENNLTTALIWFIGFSTNFVLGNLMYVILLVYCTDKGKMKELRVRWALESTFNIIKDLYYIWIGAALLDHLFLQLKSQ